MSFLHVTIFTFSLQQHVSKLQGWIIFEFVMKYWKNSISLLLFFLIKTDFNLFLNKAPLIFNPCANHKDTPFMVLVKPFFSSIELSFFVFILPWTKVAETNGHHDTKSSSDPYHLFRSFLQAWPVGSQDFPYLDPRFQPAVFASLRIMDSYTSFMPHTIHVHTISVLLNVKHKKGKYNVAVPYANCANNVCSTLI